MKYLILLTFLLIFSSCEKTLVEPPTEKIPIYQQIWETRYHPETYVIHTNPYIYNDQILTGQLNSYEKILDYNLAAYDKFTGAFIWGWNHPNNNTVILKTFGYRNFLFVKASHAIFLFDIDSKSILWEIEFSDDMTSIGSPVFIEDKAYLSTASKIADTSLKRSEMRIYDLFSGSYEILYSEEENEIKPYKPIVRNITKFENAKGQSNVVFEVAYSATEVSPRISLPDLVCINLETKEILWRRTDYNELASSFNTIKFHKGKLYNTGDWSLYAFDPNTGKELNRWQFFESYPLGSFNNTDFVIVDDVVYTLDDLGHLNGINTMTEDFEFSYKKGAARTTEIPMVKNDMIIYSSLGNESVEIFDTQLKTFVHKERYKSFGRKIIHDEETDLFYTTSSDYIHAFKVNN